VIFDNIPETSERISFGFRDVKTIGRGYLDPSDEDENKDFPLVETAKARL
jgi:hypothetical protein